VILGVWIVLNAAPGFIIGTLTPLFDEPGALDASSLRRPYYYDEPERQAARDRLEAHNDFLVDQKAKKKSGHPRPSGRSRPGLDPDLPDVLEMQGRPGQITRIVTEIRILLRIITFV